MEIAESKGGLGCHEGFLALNLMDHGIFSSSKDAGHSRNVLHPDFQGVGCNSDRSSFGLQSFLGWVVTWL